MKTWRKIFGIIFMIILFISFYYLVGLKYLTTHESIHSRIFRDYGIDSSVEYDFLRLDGNVTPGTKVRCEDACIMQNRFNDIIGYNTNVLIFCLFSLLFIYIMYKLLFE